MADRVNSLLAATEWSRAFRLIKADLLHRALYGEVAHE